MSELGNLLKELRGKMSLREASKKTGISHNYLSIVERGTDPRSGSPVNPTPETLKKLSEAYNYSYERLMKKAGYIEEPVELSAEEAAQKIIGYLDAELTNEEIVEKITLRVDGIQITDEEMDEFISFVRWQRSKKNERPAASKSEEL